VEKPKTGMARLIQIAATRRGLVIASAILSALAAVASFIPHLAMYFIIRALVGAYPSFGGALGEAVRYGWLALGGIALNILLYFAALMCSHLAAFGTLYQLKVNFASHLARVPLGFHVLEGSGKLRKIMDDNIEKIEGFIAHQIPDIVASLVAPVVMFVLLYWVDWRYGLAATAGILVAFVIQVRAYGNEGAKAWMDKYQKALEDMNNASVEYVRGIQVVKAFGQTVYSLRRMFEAIREYTRMVIPFTLSWENSMSAFTTAVNNIYLLLIPSGILIGARAEDYAAYAGQFIFYLVFVPSIASVMMKVMYVTSNGMQITGGVERMDEVLSVPPLPQPEAPRKPERYDVRFDHVGFAYPGQETPALSDVSFQAAEGQVTAIVGPSGGGKTTIAHLIPRLFDVGSGKIEIGGVDVRDMDSAKLMEKVSFVFQDVFLFKQSVLGNILIGSPRATEKDAVEAAKAAQCHEFIMRLPEGYRTVLNAGGVHLSGGEAQRIAIARAIVKDAPVVVLDEATAFADPENEYLIQRAFERLMKGKTVVMIAHRLSTVRGAKKIVVLDKGRLVEEGNHEQLLARRGKYFEMWETYTKALEWRMAREEEKAHA
jgi:ATP-binding cassette subfamily B protein